MGGTNVKIGANTSDFQNQMKSMVQNLKNVSSEFSVSATQAKLFGKESDVLKIKQKELSEKIIIQTNMVKLQSQNSEKLTKELNEQKQVQQDLKNKMESTSKAYKTACDATGENSEESKKLKQELKNLNVEYNENEKAVGKQTSKIDNANIKLNNSKKALIENGKELKNINEKLGDNKLEKFASNLEKVGEKATAAGKKMSILSAGIVGTGVGAAKAYDEVDEGMDNVIKATGATGEAAKDLEDVYKSVASGFEGDFETMGSAVGEVNTRFGYTGEAAKKCTDQFLKFSKINGTDVVSSVQGVSRAMEGAGIKSDEYSNVLDQLTIIAQATGTDINKLTENLSKYGAGTRAMGLDTKDTIALMGAFEKSGMNTETIMAGMTKASAKWAKEGKSSKTEFNKTIKAIQAAKTPIEASQIAIENFGTKSGTEFAEAIKTGKFAYTDFVTTLNNSTGTVDSTFVNTRDGMDDVKVATNNFKMAGAELGESVMGTVTPIIKKAIGVIKDCTKWFSSLSSGTKDNIVKFALFVAAIGPALIIIGKLNTGISGTIKFFGSATKIVGKVANAIKGFSLNTAASTVKLIAHKAAMVACTVAQKAMAIAQGALNFVMSLNPITLVVIAIIALIAIIVLLWNKCAWFRDLVGAMFEGLKIAFKAVIDFFKLIGSGFVAAFKAAIAAIKFVFTAVVDFFKSVWQGACNFLGSAFSAVGNGIKAVFTGIKNVVVGIAQGMVNMVIKAINFCIRMLNKLSFDVPSWVPLIGGKKFGFDIKQVQEVNWYDKGGIFTSPQVIGVGEKRPEFVGALDDLKYLIRAELQRNNTTTNNNTNTNDNGNIILTIEKFYNNTDDDIDDLVKKLDFYRKRHKK